ncbi:MAG: hypothetical protein ABSB19_13490 [Methylomonas sp.]|jgi:hypothetical protein
MQKYYVYAIFGALEPEEIDNLVELAFPADNSYQITSGQWLVKSKSNLSAEVYKTLFDGNEPSYCVITSMDGYYGWHDKAVWDWVEAAIKNGN